MLIILDGWSVHRSAEFRSFVATNYPHFHLAFLPPNCTSIGQPCDTGIQRPFKARIHTAFDKHAIRQYLGAEKSGIDAAEFKLDISLAVMKPLLVKWIVDSWLSIKIDKSIVSGAWVSSTLHRLLDPEFRVQAVQARGTTFATIATNLATPPITDESIESSEDAREHDEAAGLHDGEIDLADGIDESAAVNGCDSDDELLEVGAMIYDAPTIPVVDLHFDSDDS